MQEQISSIADKIMNTPYLRNEFLRYIELAFNISDEDRKEARERNKKIYKYALRYSPEYAYLFKD